MKQLCAWVAIFLCFPFLSFAQTGESYMKEAKKHFSLYQADQKQKYKLVLANTAVESALKFDEVQADVFAWLLRGDILSSTASEIIEINTLQLGSLKELPNVPNPAIISAYSYKKALKLASKKSQRKEALKGIATIQARLNTLAIYHYDKKEYRTAYNHFREVLNIHKVLKNEGQSSLLDKDEDYNYQRYLTGLAALNAKDSNGALESFTELYNRKYNKPAIYEALYHLHQGNGEDVQQIQRAYKYLEEGRNIFPEDNSLLFAEIRHFQRTGNLEELEGKLNKAIQREPRNITLFASLANVYDQQFQASHEAGMETSSNGYFTQAKEVYLQALKLDEANFEANYGLGSLIYTKAAYNIQKSLDIKDDGDYLQQRAIIKVLIREAMGYFQKAEAAKPNDKAVLIALKDSYAQLGEMNMMAEFKKRLEKVQSGEKVQPYFRF